MGASAIIVLLATFIVYEYWYPSILFYVDGGLQGIRILAFVEVILGPTLTFVVYSPRKPKLKADLTVICAIQFCSLLAGMYIIYSERPLAVALTDNRFFTANAVSYDFYGQSTNYLENIPGKYPKLLFIEPSSTQNNSPLARIERAPDRLLSTQARNFSDNSKRAFSQGLTSEDLLNLHPDKKNVIEAFKKRHQEKLTHAKFYMLTAKHKTSFCLFDTNSNEFIDVLDIDPGL